MDKLISEQAAIDIVEFECGKWSGLAKTIVEEIKQLPSAQSERPKGHWIDTGSGQECSECGEVQYGYDSFRYYCAKCGSDNRGK